MHKFNSYFNNTATDFDMVDSSKQSSLKIEWMDSPEAAAYLRVTVGVLRNMTSSGQVPYYKLGRRCRYNRTELDELLLVKKRGKI